MNKLRVLLVAAALLTAACGAGATHSSSKVEPASIVGVHVNRGPNADSDISDITNRPNPPSHKVGSTPTNPPVAPKVAAPRPGEPSLGSGFDRCSGGSRAGSTGPGQKHPLPECAVE
jgi:hypothetical protein